MNFSLSTADVYVPDGTDPVAALQRVTHLAIVAHADDIEFMCHSAITHCMDESNTDGFGGVVVTNGAGSARTGPYAHLSNEEMVEVRREEQRTAARLGHYAIQLQLDHPSAAVKSGGAGASVEADLATILSQARPREVYLHNPADKHDTHVGLFLRALAALRALPAEQQPERVLGIEGWRGLDWVLSADKVGLDDSAHGGLRLQLAQVFDSQITGGKRYDVAIEGRRAANATMDDSHSVDDTTHRVWAMDLTPLVRDPSLSVSDFTTAFVDRLRADVVDRLGRLA
jgi:LmbE family N-acetylglucosaminyl deacetylase